MIKNCFILNYHSVYDVGASPTHIDPVYTVDAKSFRAHLDLFQRLDLNVVNLNELSQLNRPDQLTICLTFDDGHSSDHEIVLPLLEEYGFKGSFFPTLVNFKEHDERWKQYSLLAASGHVIGAHGVTHRYLSNMPPEKQYHELKHSKDFIEEKIGNTVNYFALPGGKYNRKTIALAKESGYQKVLTTEFEFIDQNNSPFALGRWSLKKNHSTALLERVLTKDLSTIRKISLQKKVVKSMSQLLGNNLTDQLNYLINQ